MSTATGTGTSIGQRSINSWAMRKGKTASRAGMLLRAQIQNSDTDTTEATVFSDWWWPTVAPPPTTRVGLNPFIPLTMMF